MSALAKIDLTPGEIEILAKGGVIPHGTPPEQVSLFAAQARAHNLNPFKGEISLIKFGSNYVPTVRIDGARQKAQRTGQYAGIEDAKFDVQADGSYKTAAELKAANRNPISCTITVYRNVGGQRCPFTYTAIFSEFSSGQNKWATMPFQMIRKVATMHALKEGFGDELAGLYIDEEMAAFQNETMEVKQKPKSLPELDQTHEKWDDVVTALRLGQCDIPYVRTRFTLSDENEKLLLKEAAEQ